MLQISRLRVFIFAIYVKRTDDLIRSDTHPTGSIATALFFNSSMLVLELVLSLNMCLLRPYCDKTSRQIYLYPSSLDGKDKQNGNENRRGSEFQAIVGPEQLKSDRIKALGHPIQRARSNFQSRLPRCFIHLFRLNPPDIYNQEAAFSKPLFWAQDIHPHLYPLSPCWKSPSKCYLTPLRNTSV